MPAVSVVIGGVATGLSVAAIALHVAAGGSVNPHWATQVINGLLFGGLGMWLGSRRVAGRLGLVFVVGAVAAALTAFSSHYALPVDAAPFTRPGAAWIAWVGSWTWILGLAAITNLSLLLFPTGRPPSRSWYGVAALSVTGAVLGAVALAASTWGIGRTRDEPTPPGAGLDISSDLLQVGAVLAAASLVWRYRRATGIERYQVRPMMFAAAAIVGGFVASFNADAFGRFEWLIAPAAVGSVAFAIVRHELFDVQLVVNRALVHGCTAAALAVVYAGAAIAAGSLSASTRLPAIVAAIAVAFSFGPIRLELERRVNRVLYGYRHEPVAALEQLGERLAEALNADEVAPSIVAAVEAALRVPAVRLDVLAEDRMRAVAASGDARVPEGGEVFPVLWHGERLGQLVVWPRPGTNDLSAADRRVIDTLARQAGPAVHALRLTVELRASREQLVAAREEERRRMRRDLHDGLGAQLSGMLLGIQAVRNLSADRPEVAELLDVICTDAQEAVADIRRLVYALRPPALDELGLVGAIRQHVATLATRADDAEEPAPIVHIDAPLSVTLPAAVEVAAYRIALEALTNVWRHANAQNCDVRLNATEGLMLEVSDDGRGLPVGWQPGVGVRSIRERVAELGGRVSFDSAPQGGTRVTACFPIAAPS